MTTHATYALIRKGHGEWLDLATFAARAGLHPELVRRLVALGLLEAQRDAADRLWLAPVELATVARIQRLRTGFSLNYAAVGLVMDLLDRIDELEAALRLADQHAAYAYPRNTMDETFRRSLRRTSTD